MKLQTKPNLAGTVTEWRLLARCLGRDVEDFFSELGGPMQQAKEFCAPCPVWRECLASALAECPGEQDYGIRGGTSVMDRRWLRRLSRFRRQRGYTWLECVVASEEQIRFHVQPLRKRGRERESA